MTPKSNDAYTTFSEAPAGADKLFLNNPTLRISVSRFARSCPVTRDLGQGWRVGQR